MASQERKRPPQQREQCPPILEWCHHGDYPSQEAPFPEWEGFFFVSGEEGPEEDEGDETVGDCCWRS
jgi:hypothetical protein